MLRKNVRVNIGKSKMVFKIFPQSTHNYLRNEKKNHLEMMKIHGVIRIREILLRSIYFCRL